MRAGQSVRAACPLGDIDMVLPLAPPVPACVCRFFGCGDPVRPTWMNALSAARATYPKMKALLRNNAAQYSAIAQCRRCAKWNRDSFLCHDCTAASGS